MNTLFTLFLLLDFMFVACGALLLAAAVIWQDQRSQRATQETASNIILLSGIPFSAIIVNAALIFLTFIVSIPAMIMPRSITWLKAHGWLIIICSFYTLGLGVDIWLETLTTRANLAKLWNKNSPDIQSLIQQQFNCCGYMDFNTPKYVQDSTCPTDSVAATKPGCVGPFANFATESLVTIFTCFFGIVALEVVLLLFSTMLVKVRGEQRRYKAIDSKRGLGNI